MHGTLTTIVSLLFTPSLMAPVEPFVHQLTYGFYDKPSWPAVISISVVGTFLLLMGVLIYWRILQWSSRSPSNSNQPIFGQLSFGRRRLQHMGHSYPLTPMRRTSRHRGTQRPPLVIIHAPSPSNDPGEQDITEARDPNS